MRKDSATADFLTLSSSSFNDFVINDAIPFLYFVLYTLSDPARDPGHHTIAGRRQQEETHGVWLHRCFGGDLHNLLLPGKAMIVDKRLSSFLAPFSGKGRG
jgi:hypothetical protein